MFDPITGRPIDPRTGRPLDPSWRPYMDGRGGGNPSRGGGIRADGRMDGNPYGDEDDPMGGYGRGGMYDEQAALERVLRESLREAERHAERLNQVPVLNRVDSEQS